MFRKILFWLHLAAGCVAGLVILIMSVTGVLLTYEKQVIAWADPRTASQVAAPAVGGGSALGVEALLVKVQEGQGTLPANITLRANASEPVTMTLGRDTVLVDPATGRVLVPQQTGVRAFFRSVTDWHRWLGASAQGAGAGDARALARSITGASNLMFLFIVVSGLYLWLPRKWKRQNVRAILLFRGGLSGKARDFNWHNVAGFWAFLPLFFVVLSGVVISYPWASNLVYTVNGMQPPNQGKNKGKEGNVGKQNGGERRGKGERAEENGPGRRKDRGNGEIAGNRERAGETPADIVEVSFAGLDTAVAQARQQVPNWRTMSFPIPRSEQAPIVIAVDTGTGGQPQMKSTLTMDRATAQVVKWDRFEDQEKGRQVRSWMRFVHTGEYYGIAGQTVAGVASAAGALLVWTGLALALRRFRTWLARDRSSNQSGVLSGVLQEVE